MRKLYGIQIDKTLIIMSNKQTMSGSRIDNSENATHTKKGINIGREMALRHDPALGVTSDTTTLYTNSADKPAQPVFTWKTYTQSATYQATEWAPYTGSLPYKWFITVTLTATPDVAWPIGTNWNAQLIAQVGAEQGVLSVVFIGATEKYDFLPDKLELTRQ